MWLALETATDRASVALRADGGPTLEEGVEGARRHAATLLPLTERLLARAGRRVTELAAVAVSDGPGSFTGLRVGAAVAKALVRARGIPLWTAPSLMVRAAGVGQSGRAVLAVSNALRGEVYAAVYRLHPDRVETLHAPEVWRPAELIERIARPDVLVAEAPAEVVELLERWVGSPAVRAPEAAPRAAVLLDLVGRAGGAVQVDNAEAWEPVYGRPAEAQARWESAHGRPLPHSAGQAG